MLVLLKDSLGAILPVWIFGCVLVFFMLKDSKLPKYCYLLVPLSFLLIIFLLLKSNNSGNTNSGGTKDTKD